MTDGPIVPVRVMIVDDDPLILTVFTKELDAQPTVSVCATAAGGEQALETLSWRRHHIDVILLDISMPGLNGIQTARAIHRSLFSGHLRAFPGIDIMMARSHEV